MEIVLIGPYDEAKEALERISDRELLKKSFASLNPDLGIYDFIPTSDRIYIKICGKLGHEWNGCKCEKCGEIRDKEHDYGRGCECKRCGKTVHDFVGCECRRCGKMEHDWERITKTPFFVENGYESGNTIGHYAHKYKCRRCGTEKEEKV
jgi:hypothetical protein